MDRLFHQRGSTKCSGKRRRTATNSEAKESNLPGPYIYQEFQVPISEVDYGGRERTKEEEASVERNTRGQE